MTVAAPYRNPALAWIIAVLLSLSAASALVSGQWLVGVILPAILLYLAAFRHTEWFFRMLLFSIPLSMEVQVAHSLGTDLPDEAFMWLLTLPILAMVLQGRDKASDTIRTHIIFRILLVQLLWAAVTIFFSTYPLLSFKYLLAKTWYMVPFAAGAVFFLNDRRSTERAVLLLLSAMLIASMVVVSRHAMHGFSFDSVNAATKPLFRNHVNYSALLVCMLPLSVAGAVLYPDWRKAFILLSAFWLAALFITYSRGAWVAVPAGIISAWAIHRKMGKWLAMGIIVVLSGAILFLAQGNRYLDFRPDFNRTIYHTDLAGHMQATYRLRDLSTAERFHRWIAAARMMEGHWWTGYGPNSFYPEYRSHTVSVFRTYVSDNPERSTVHNYFLLLLTEQGIPGLAFFLLLLGCLFHFASRAYHGASDRFGKVRALTIAAMLGMILVLISLSDLVETDKVGSLFYLCAGVLALATVPSARVANGIDPA